MNVAVVALRRHFRRCHSQDAEPLPLHWTHLNKLCELMKKFDTKVTSLQHLSMKNWTCETEYKSLHSDALARHVGSFWKQSCSWEEASIQGKHEDKKLLCMSSFSFNLLARIECYQLLRFPDRTYFLWITEKWTHRAMLYSFLQFRKTIGALHHTLPVRRPHSSWSGEELSKEGNPETKLSNVRPERCHLHKRKK